MKFELRRQLVKKKQNIKFREKLFDADGQTRGSQQALFAMLREAPKSVYSYIILKDQFSCEDSSVQKRDFKVRFKFEVQMTMHRDKFL